MRPAPGTQANQRPADGLGAGVPPTLLWPPYSLHVCEGATSPSCMNPQHQQPQLHTGQETGVHSRAKEGEP